MVGIGLVYGTFGVAIMSHGQHLGGLMVNTSEDLWSISGFQRDMACGSNCMIHLVLKAVLVQVF